jgi:hypothetical protein
MVLTAVLFQSTTAFCERAGTASTLIKAKLTAKRDDSFMGSPSWSGFVAPVTL